MLTAARRPGVAWLRPVCYPPRQAASKRVRTKACGVAGMVLFGLQRIDAGALGDFVERIEWHYTPKYGSWLNMAGSELSVWSDQCLDRRIPDKQTLTEEVAALEDRRNKKRGRAARFARIPPSCEQLCRTPQGVSALISPPSRRPASQATQPE